MKREDIQRILEQTASDPKAQVDGLLDALHGEIRTHKDAAEAAKRELADSQFAALVQGALQSAKARSTRAAQALLDLETIRADSDPKAALQAAIDGLVQSAETAFLFEEAGQPSTPAGQPSTPAGQPNTPAGQPSTPAAQPSPCAGPAEAFPGPGSPCAGPAEAFPGPGSPCAAQPSPYTGPRVDVGGKTENRPLGQDAFVASARRAAGLEE